MDQLNSGSIARCQEFKVELVPQQVGAVAQWGCMCVVQPLLAAVSLSLSMLLVGEC